MYHANVPNTPTAAVTRPSPHQQLKHTTHNYFHFLNTNCKHHLSFRRWFCSPWTPHTIFHNFCTSNIDRRLCSYNKKWTMEESITSITYHSYKYLHILTIKFLAHIPHFTKTMALCSLVSIISASPSLTALQVIQYIYMHAYSVHLSLSYSTLWYKNLHSLRNNLRPCGQFTILYYIINLSGSCF